MNKRQNTSLIKEEIMDYQAFIEWLLSYVRPELLLLFPAALIAGKVMKDNEKVKDTSIPSIIAISGSVIGVLITITLSAMTTWQQWLQAIISGGLMGLICAGAAVFAHQLYKQKQKAE